MKLKYLTSFELEALPPYNFELTVHKPLGYHWLTPGEVFSSGKIWTAMELSSERLVGIRLKSIGTVENPMIEMAVFSDEKLEESEEKVLINDITKCAELNVDINAFYSMAKHDSILKYTLMNLYGMRCGRQQKLFHNIVRAILMQWASLERTKQMFKLLFQSYARKIRFDGHLVSTWFTPKQIAQASLQKLKKECKLGFRAEYLRTIANLISSGLIPSLEDLEKMPFEKAKKELMKLRGIGEYSAEIALPHRERFPIDVWSVKIFWKLLFPGKEMSSVKIAIQEIRKQAERRWKMWRSYAFIYIINDLNNLSRKIA